MPCSSARQRRCTSSPRGCGSFTLIGRFFPEDLSCGRSVWLLLAFAGHGGCDRCRTAYRSFWEMIGVGLLAFVCALWTGFWIALLILVLVAAVRLRVAAQSGRE